MIRITARQYAQILYQRMEAHPDQASKVAAQFLKNIYHRREQAILPFIFQHLAKLEDKKNNRSKVQIKSARPLLEEEKKQITQYLQKQKQLSSEILFEESTDESLLGGFQLQWEDQKIDFSMLGQLRRFEEQIKNKEKTI